MTATAEQIAKLADPTPKEEIGLIPGKGGSGDLSYITARFAQQRLDDSVGAENWMVAFVTLGASLYAQVSVLTEGGWVMKSDVGTESKIEAEKGNASDAFKRACVMWGIARDLYPGPKKTVASQAEAKKPRAKKAKPVDSTAEVVGTTDISDAQRKLIFASLRSLGWDKKRKSAAFLCTTKNSFKQMTAEDASRFIDILNYAEGKESGNADFDAVIDNIGMVAEDGASE
jgi:hypothetical protein